MPPLIPRQYKLCGFDITAFNKDTLLHFISTQIASSNRTVIANINLHGLYCALRSKDMSSLFSRTNTFIHIDGMPIVWLLRLRGAKVNATNRLTYLDWCEDLLAMAAKASWRVAYIGSSPEICAKGETYFIDRFPGLELKGWDGFFDLHDTSPDSKLSKMIREISAFHPAILIVGMGMPRQETFLDMHQEDLGFKVGLCSGAFIEYFVGGQAKPPRWIGRLGVEWLYRLLLNPRRYANRYLVEPWLIIYLLLSKRWLK